MQVGDSLSQLRDVLLCVLASLQPALAEQLAALGTTVTGDHQHELYKRAQLQLYSCRFDTAPAEVRTSVHPALIRARMQHSPGCATHHAAAQLSCGQHPSLTHRL